MPVISVKKSNILYHLQHCAPGSEEEVNLLKQLRGLTEDARIDEKQCAEEIGNMVNNFSFNAISLAVALGTQHRTLQQGFTRVCVAWICYLAKQEHFDLRNEASVKMAKQIAKCEDQGLVNMALPYI